MMIRVRRSVDILFFSRPTLLASHACPRKMLKAPAIPHSMSCSHLLIARSHVWFRLKCLKKHVACIKEIQTAIVDQLPRRAPDALLSEGEK